jgi:hypothetical protein
MTTGDSLIFADEEWMAEHSLRRATLLDCRFVIEAIGV